MNGPTETQEVEINLAPIAGTRVAYTLNNKQPVKCSFIGAEPLFFMDTDEIIEEDSMFEDFSLDMFDGELEDLRKKIDSYDAISKEFHENEASISDLFSNDAAFITSELPNEGSLEHLTDILKQSRFAETLLDYAQTHGVEICYSTHVKIAEYDREAGKIFIHPSLEIGYQVLLASTELRRVWQHKNGALVDPMAFYPDHGILINRLQEADVNAFMIRIAWELKLAGEKDAWALVECSTFSDLGRAFAREACTDFRASNNGQALLSIVEAWFLSERCRKHDRTLIQRMLAGKSPEGFAHSQELSRQALIEAIYALGKNPYGNNYLAPHMELLIEDPIFSEVRDRSNANFLWFVKFESSFAQAEQELQMEGSLDGQTSQFEQFGQGSTPYEAEVIQFPNMGQQRSKSFDTTGHDGHCDIVPFSQG
ncbi:MAG: hypothetical protein JKY11_06530 [Alphaproteobacteria bacterium]|nr:hypothetical protein [Alphaproteobacteria bacterium]